MPGFWNTGTASSGPGGSAASVTYDGASSGLTADDVQEAIDELASDLGALEPGGGASVIGTQADGPLSVLGTTLTKQGRVLDLGASGQWDAQMVESPAVFYDPTRGQFGMVYVGYGSSTGAQRGQIGLAWSDDLLTWERDANNPLLPHSGVSGEPDENGCSGPVIWREAGVWHLFYIGLTATGYEAGTKRLCHASTTDDDLSTATWTRHGAIISPTGSGWRSTAIWHPNIVKRDGTYYLFFNAHGGAEVIGYATSTDLDTWTVDDVNSPILTNGPGWDSGWIGDPSVMSVRMPDGRVGWIMAYYGYAGGSAHDGLAFTTDDEFPLGWRKYSGNPILSPGPSGTIDAKFAHKPFRFVWGDRLFHYYTAVAGDDRRTIALATDAPASSGILGLDDLADVDASPTKGALLAGTGSRWVPVGPGADGQSLVADSAQVAGVRFAAPTGGATETVFAPAYTVTDGPSLDLAVTFVWGIDTNGDPYYNAAGVNSGEEAVLVLNNTTGEFSLRPVEV